MMPYNGYDIYQKIHAPGRFTESLSDGSQAAAKLKELHYDVATELASIRVSMSEHWEGEAATAATAKLDKFLASSAETAEKVAPSMTSMDNQGSAFWDTRHAVQEMPAKPEDGNNGFVQFVTLGIADSQEEKNAQWEEKNRHNITQYNNYAARSTGNESQFVKEYGETPGSGGSADDSRTGSSSGGHNRGSSTPTVGGAGGLGGGEGPGSGGSGSASSSPQVNVPAASTGTTPSSSYPPPVSGYTPPQATSPSGYVPGGTSPAGYASAAGEYGPGAGGPGGTGLGGTGRGGRGAAGGAGGDFGPMGSGAVGGVTGGVGGGAAGAG
ncbi:MAG: hypothetical protein ACRDQW_05355, partial [Haloechinothrix sp.]